LIIVSKNGGPLMTTRLVYLDDSLCFERSARVVRVEAQQFSPQVTVVLDETIFYPQGGGQPTDKGTIAAGDSRVAVDKVSFVDGEVLHAGILAGPALAPDDTVQLEIDGDRRHLHMRLHTGGHLIMTAVDRLLRLPATKGYHFPDGPYVEFDGDVPPDDRDGIVIQLQAIIDDLIREDSEVTARYETVDNLRAMGVHIPAEIPAGKPTRVVITSGYHSPCGGTHVRRLGELPGLRVKTIKAKSGRLRVSYGFNE
jgi:Ser-tRNA(Ala) deacylase AlaX